MNTPHTLSSEGKFLQHHGFHTPRGSSCCWSWAAAPTLRGQAEPLLPSWLHKKFAIPHCKHFSIKCSPEIFHKALHIKLYLTGAATGGFLSKEPGMREQRRARFGGAAAEEHGGHRGGCFSPTSIFSLDVEHGITPSNESCLPLPWQSPAQTAHRQADN